MAFACMILESGSVAISHSTAPSTREAFHGVLHCRTNTVSGEALLLALARVPFVCVCVCVCVCVHVCI